MTCGGLKTLCDLCGDYFFYHEVPEILEVREVLCAHTIGVDQCVSVVSKIFLTTEVAKDTERVKHKKLNALCVSKIFTRRNGAAEFFISPRHPLTAQQPKGIQKKTGSPLSFPSAGNDDREKKKPLSPLRPL